MYGHCADGGGGVFSKMHFKLISPTIVSISPLLQLKVYKKCFKWTAKVKILSRISPSGLNELLRSCELFGTQLQFGNKMLSTYSGLNSDDLNVDVEIMSRTHGSLATSRSSFAYQHMKQRYHR
uniref:Uncharacterized protein n=1 Tax=Glossina austeni TaxID=7395 RepID=A0A1A9VV71_GLOAU